jgi:UDP-N-acetylmuramyl pentapeptide phosphotransferase/UDP-N-acetylglucosamine-1-phosphate transferase
MTFAIGIFFKYIKGDNYDGYFPNFLEYSLFVCGLLLIYLGGVKDDFIGIRYRHKFLIQILSAVWKYCRKKMAYFYVCSWSEKKVYRDLTNRKYEVFLLLVKDMCRKSM